MTANLNINYRNPTPAGAFVVLRAKTVKVDGRKAWVEGHIETLVGEGEKPVVLVEASALFIEPRQAAVSGYLLTPGRYLREANIVLDNGKSLSGSINEARKWTSVSESKVQSQEFF
jgi:3'-phosphoadenosine 5'-phosphosulfate synthase